MQTGYFCSKSTKRFMLVEFRVANFRSIADEQVFSLVPATNQREHPDNIINTGKMPVLNAAAIYGANGSGKSNLLLAMNMLDRIVHISGRSSSTTRLPYDPFLLKNSFRARPTKFEIVFLINDLRYRYGVEYFQKRISREWLYRKAVGREVLLFGREDDVIDVQSGFKGNQTVIDAAIEATRPNGLFLSTCDAMNITEAKEIFKWFRHFSIIDGIDTENEEIRTVSMWEKEPLRKEITDYLLHLNLGFKAIDIDTKDFDENDLPKGLNDSFREDLIVKLKNAQSYSVSTAHQIYTEDGLPVGESIKWNMDDRESKGTIKAFHLSGPILSALRAGGVLIVDEIEAKIHPLITISIIDLFLNRNTNPNNAQLVFATHDTNLLSYSKLRRDQIFFTEKNAWEATEIYALSDFRYPTSANGKLESERPDSDKEKRYIEGRYGAIPCLGLFNPNNYYSHGAEREDII